VRFAQSIIDTFPQLQLRLPDHTFSDRVEFKGSKRTAEFVTFGGGHTESDAFLYLPAERIIFAGDLLVIKNHPDLTHGDPHAWLGILAKVKALNPIHLIPGHGGIGTLDDVIMIDRYINELLQMAEENQLEETSDLKPLGFTEEWDNAEAFEENLKFLRNKYRDNH
jgi:glyoxylase-like metal-dependent hydrolase (beta-lactamase superfamily II)